ncbi:hypothetical protein NOVO_09175 (plasmid) [Rickettsiales bacterium Ac37b]|nr:hypothetical protein NOVO_09175 [Rickettsiales bacterium Ac37b]
MTKNKITDTKQFTEFFVAIKEKVKSAQYTALKAVNKELISLYWEVGKIIVQKQAEQGWGKSVVELLAKELQAEFPGTQGFSVTSLWRMRNFYLAYHNDSKLAQAAREIAWTHNFVIIERCKDNLEREYYIQIVRRSGWSRETLMRAIKNQSYEKFILNQTNFETKLSPVMSKEAKLALKDEYSFDFLELGEKHAERDLERELLNNIRRFLTEMGHYFTFVGSQYRIEVDDKEFFIDLLLYHRKLRCLVAIELKRKEFKPEYLGKMQFYLSALDDLVRLDDENPSIGIIVCEEKSRTMVEYTLRDVNKPMGVATYTTEESLPKAFKGLLPSPEEIAHHLRVFKEEENE